MATSTALRGSLLPPYLPAIDEISLPSPDCVQSRPRKFRPQCEGRGFAGSGCPIEARWQESQARIDAQKPQFNQEGQNFNDL